MLSVKEIFQDTVRAENTKRMNHSHMVLKKIYAIRDCIINPSYVVAAYPHEFNSSADRGMLDDIELPSGGCTRLILDGNSFRSSEMIVAMPYDDLKRMLK